MKKTLVLIALSFLSIGDIFAQNSNIDIIQQSTKADLFLSNTQFKKEIEITNYSDNGLEINGRLFVDLKDETKKTGAIEFRTESKTALGYFALALGGGQAALNAIEDGKSKPLGYLDLDEVSSLLNVLQNILDNAKIKSDYDYTIDYIAPGGINVYYEYDEDFGDQTIFFRKAWYSVNSFGVKEVSYVNTEPISVKKSLKEIIETITDAKTKIEAELAK